MQVEIVSTYTVDEYELIKSSVRNILQHDAVMISLENDSVQLDNIDVVQQVRLGLIL